MINEKKNNMLPPNVSWAYDMHYYLGSFVLLLYAFF